jgi:hypothetical protein
MKVKRMGFYLTMGFRVLGSFHFFFPSKTGLTRKFLCVVKLCVLSPTHETLF